jgi:peptide/nickel transport system substrate-binding protein
MRIRKRLAGLLAVGAAAALVLSACGTGGDESDVSRGFDDCLEDPNNCNGGERAQGGTIIWTLDQAPDGYFPWSPEGGSVYTLQAIHGILPYFGQFQPDGTYKYNMDVLASEPELVSTDPFEYVFRINPNAVWNDGTPVSAEDVILLWKMSTSESQGHCIGCRPRSSAGFDVIESVTSEDDGKTARIRLKEGITDPEWFAFGSAHGIVGGIPPAHIGKREGFISGGPDDWDPEGLGEYFEYLNNTPADWSGGPYLIEEFDIDTQVVKVPNPNWYGEVKPTLDRVVIRFLTDADTWVPALQNGELHGASPAGFSEDVIRQVRDLDGVRVHIGAGPSWDHVDLNMDNEWLGQHKALRQAIFIAIDAAEIAERNFGALFPNYSLRTNHVHSASSEFHVNHLEGTGQGTGDIDLARSVLEAAGFEGMDGGAGALTYQGETVGPFRLRSTNAPARQTSLQLIQSYLADIGIQANIEITDDLGGTLVSQDYDIMQFGWSGSPLFTGTGSQYWRSDSGSNFGRYSNPEVDRLTDEEQKATSLEESARLHDEMMKIVVEDAYVLPLYDSPVYVFVTEDYVNVRDNANTSLRALYEHHSWGLAIQ